MYRTKKVQHRRHLQLLDRSPPLHAHSQEPRAMGVPTLRCSRRRQKALCNSALFPFTNLSRFIPKKTHKQLDTRKTHHLDKIQNPRSRRLGSVDDLPQGRTAHYPPLLGERHAARWAPALGYGVRAHDTRWPEIRGAGIRERDQSHHGWARVVGRLGRHGRGFRGQDGQGPQAETRKAPS